MKKLLSIPMLFLFTGLLTNFICSEISASNQKNIHQDWLKDSGHFPKDFTFGLLTLVIAQNCNKGEEIEKKSIKKIVNKILGDSNQISPDLDRIAKCSIKVMNIYSPQMLADAINSGYDSQLSVKFREIVHQSIEK